MKQLNTLTTYELYMYSSLDYMNVEYIQFNDELISHQVGEIKTMKELYDEWNEFQREDCIFTATIKWFTINQTENLVTICLDGVDGRLHYEHK